MFDFGEVVQLEEEYLIVRVLEEVCIILEEYLDEGEAAVEEVLIDFGMNFHNNILLMQ